MKKVLSIDLGGQSAKCAIISESAKVLYKFQIKTKKNNIINNIYDEVINFFNENNININDIEGIGFGTPGFVHEGVVVLSGNLNWTNYDLKSKLEEKFKKPVVINNDANAAALGEFWIGGGKKYKDIIFYILGTGVGGGIILNNKLISGSNGFAGELGHGGNFQSQFKCTCGMKNCIEPLSSAIGMEKLINDFAHKNEKSILNKMLKEKHKELSLIDIRGLLQDNNEEIKSVIREAIKPLSSHISTMIFALNPQAIVIGGGPSNLGDPFLKIIEEEVNKNMLDFMKETYDIKIGILKNDAGIFGNAYSILNHLNL